jgi:rhodanese-related sulfurtransferase
MSPNPSLSPLEVDCQTVRQKLDNGEALLFLDCREQNEYDLVHIEGTIFLPMSQIQERVGELEEYKSGEIVVHCHHGGRSLRVAGWLSQLGYANVKSLAGGIDLWAQVVDPTLARY